MVKMLVKIIYNGDYSKFVKKNGEMLKNVVENIFKKICTELLLLSGYYKILFLTQSFTNIFCHLKLSLISHLYGS